MSSSASRGALPCGEETFAEGLPPLSPSDEFSSAECGASCWNLGMHSVARGPDASEERRYEPPPFSAGLGSVDCVKGIASFFTNSNESLWRSGNPRRSGGGGLFESHREVASFLYAELPREASAPCEAFPPRDAGVWRLACALPEKANMQFPAEAASRARRCGVGVAASPNWIASTSCPQRQVEGALRERHHLESGVDTRTRPSRFSQSAWADCWPPEVLFTSALHETPRPFHGASSLFSKRQGASLLGDEGAAAAERRGKRRGRSKRKIPLLSSRRTAPLAGPPLNTSGDLSLAGGNLSSRSRHNDGRCGVSAETGAFRAATERPPAVGEGAARGLQNSLSQWSQRLPPKIRPQVAARTASSPPSPLSRLERQRRFSPPDAFSNASFFPQQRSSAWGGGASQLDEEAPLFRSPRTALSRPLVFPFANQKTLSAPHERERRPEGEATFPRCADDDFAHASGVFVEDALNAREGFFECLQSELHVAASPQSSSLASGEFRLGEGVGQRGFSIQQDSLTGAACEAVEILSTGGAGTGGAAISTRPEPHIKRPRRDDAEAGEGPDEAEDESLAVSLALGGGCFLPQGCCGQRVWVPGALPERRQETVIIFDWDDTFFPNTWFAARRLEFTQLFELPAASQTSPLLPQLPQERRQLRKIERSGSKLLRAAVCLGSVVLVTNAAHGWIEETCCKFLPGLWPLVSRVRRVSARFRFDSPACESPFIWKRLAFREELERHLRRHSNCRTVVSVGDGPHERDALLLLRADYSHQMNFLTKSLKLLEMPSLDYLSKQHSLVTHSFIEVLSHDGNLDLVVRTSDHAANEALLVLDSAAERGEREIDAVDKRSVLRELNRRWRQCKRTDASLHLDHHHPEHHPHNPHNHQQHHPHHHHPEHHHHHHHHHDHQPNQHAEPASLGLLADSAESEWPCSLRCLVSAPIRGESLLCEDRETFFSAHSTLSPVQDSQGVESATRSNPTGCPAAVQDSGQGGAAQEALGEEQQRQRRQSVPPL